MFCVEERNGAMASKLNAREKLQRKKEPKKVKLDAAFGGMKPGDMMHVSTPLLVDAYIRKIPVGTVTTIAQMRDDLAQDNGCDGTCPLSSSIFVRMVGEAALEDIDEGKPLDQVAPFWRILEGKDKISGKLNVDPDWIDQQRAIEAEN